ncbi:MAG: P-loop NTPase [Dehalococcoidales bacterium]
MIISIASGKGGTGKTLVATSLALAINDGDGAQLVDCDVEEPNAHIIMKPVITHRETVSIPVPRVAEDKCSYCGRCAEVCAYNAMAVMGDVSLYFRNSVMAVVPAAIFARKRLFLSTRKR